MDAGITSFKIEGRMKEADYVKNVTAFYRQKLDEIFERRTEYVPSSRGHCQYTFEVNPEKSFNRGFTDFFINGRQKNIGAPFTPKSMGEYIGEVTWCNPLRMEIATDKTLHNGDGLCFLNADDELIGIRADVVHGSEAARHVSTVACNRPHGAHRGAKIYRNYDIEWQKQVEASNGNRKIDIDFSLAEIETGYELTALCHCEALSNPDKGTDSLDCFAPLAMTTTHCEKIEANNPEKATDNIRKKALQWGDTPFNPIDLELKFDAPRLIPASVIGEMKRQLVEKLTDALIDDHQTHRSMRKVEAENPMENPQLLAANSQLSTEQLLTEQLSTEQLLTDPDEIPDHLMACHHCIRYANGLCSKETGQKAEPLFIRNGSHIFRLEFDCKNCLMHIQK